jgi:hypothetical protein
MATRPVASRRARRRDGEVSRSMNDDPIDPFIFLQIRLEILSVGRSRIVTPGACGGPDTVMYTASQGTITGDAFDSSSMSFDQSNRLKQQI